MNISGDCIQQTLDASMPSAAGRVRGGIFWLTGLSGAGKSTLAHGLKTCLDAQSIPAVVLDGDRVRAGLNTDLGFSTEDRAENIRRVAEVAALIQESGVVAIASLISPLRADRDAARQIAGSRFFEIYVNASLDICEARDPKGLYVRARREEIREFTGIGSAYEKPDMPDLTIDTGRLTLEQSTQILQRFALDALRLPPA